MGEPTGPHGHTPNRERPQVGHRRTKFPDRENSWLLDLPMGYTVGMETTKRTIKMEGWTITQVMTKDGWWNIKIERTGKAS